MTSKIPLSEQEQYELYGKLCDACERRDTQEIKRLLDLGVSASNEQWEKEHKHSCLAEFLFFGRELEFEDFKDIFKQLCTAGANPHHYNYDSGSLLTNAIMHGYSKEAVAWLIDEIKLDVNGRNIYGETPLFDAVYTRFGTNAEIIKLLLERGADPLLRNKENKLPYDEAPEHLKELLPKPKPALSQAQAWQKTAPPKIASGWLDFFKHIVPRDKPEQHTIEPKHTPPQFKY